MIKGLWIALASLAISQLAPLGASQSTLQKIDLEPHLLPWSSHPKGPEFGFQDVLAGPMVEVAGEFYFTATTRALGTELYKTDGTSGGTSLVLDLTPGPGSTAFGDMKALGGRLYFVAGKFLWSTAGTAGTTQQESGWVPSLGPGGFLPGLAVANSKLFFRTSTPAIGFELFVLDPSSGMGPVGIDILPGPVGSEPRTFVAHPNGVDLLFEVTMPGTGQTLWKSDGTAAGTSMVIDLTTSLGYDTFHDPVPLGSGVVFMTPTDALGMEPFFTDGTAAGTFQLADIYPGSFGSAPSIRKRGLHNGLLYFSAESPVVGRELFRTDGTVAGTFLVVDGAPGAVSSDPVPMGVAGGKLIVHAMVDATGIGKELYRLDATGLTLIKNLIPELSPGVEGSLIVGDSVAVGNKLFFGSGSPYSEPSQDQQLWSTDGTAQGTWPLANMTPGILIDVPMSITPISPTSALFAGADPIHGIELFRTDGTPGGTGVVVDLDPGLGPVSSNPYGLVCLNGADLYFYSRAFGASFNRIQRWTQASGLETIREMAGIWESHGAWLGDQTTTMLMFNNSMPGTPFLEILQLDTDVKVVADAAGTLSGAADILGAANGQTYFLGHTAATGTELWTTDGTQVGTKMVMDLAPGPGSGLSAGFGSGLSKTAIESNGSFFFTAFSSAGNRALWKTDGTALGTTMIKDVDVTNAFAVIQPVLLGETLFFVADDGVHGLELWKSDGTSAGTAMVKDITPGIWPVFPQFLVSMGGSLFFTTRGGPSGDGMLWRSDGTSAGTTVVASINLKYSKGKIVAAGGKLFFEAYDPVHGLELWASDGVSSAYMVKDSEPGITGAGALEIAAVGNRVYYQAREASMGAELFVSDGTAAGTHVAVDINTGPGDSDPRGLTLAGGDLFFTAKGTDEDYELYRYTLPGAHVLDLGFGGNGARLSSSAPVVGGTVTATLDYAPPGAMGALLMSGFTTASSLGVSPGGASWIDLANAVVLGAGATPSWTVAALIPPSSGLIGAEVQLQGWFLDPLAATLTTSNGVRLILGL